VQNLGYNQNGGGLIDDKLIMSLNARKEFRAISAIKGSFANVVDIYYELGTGDFTVTSNPSGWNQFVENSTGSGLGIYKMDFGTLAGHEIFVNANEDGVELYGINRYVKDVSGVIVHKATSNGYSLYRSENLVALQRHKDIVQSLDPDLIIIALGTNFAGREVQAGNPTTPNAMAGNIDSVRRAYEQLLPNAEFVHWGHADKLENPSEPDFVYLMKEYDNIFFRTAVKNNYSYLSFYKFHGPARKMLNTGILEDSVHYSALGALAHRDFILDYTLGDCSTESAEITVAQGLLKGDDDVIKLGRQKNNGAETANMTESREITGASGLHLNLAGGVGLSIAPSYRTPLNGSLLYAENQNNTANTAYFTGGSVSVLSLISTGTATGLYARANGTGAAADFRLGDGTAPSASAFVTRINKLKAPSGVNALSASFADFNAAVADGDGAYDAIYLEGVEVHRIGGRVHDISTGTYESIFQIKAENGSFATPLLLRGTATGAEAIATNLHLTGTLRDNTGSLPGAGQVPVGNVSGGFDWGSSAGDNLGNHTMTQALITGLNAIKNASATGYESVHNASEWIVREQGAISTDYFAVRDGHTYMPTLSATPVTSIENSSYFKSEDDTERIRVRPYVLLGDDRDTGSTGLNPVTETQILTARDIKVRSVVLEADLNDETSTADPAERIGELGFRNVDAGRYRYEATIYHSKDASTDTHRADFEFFISGSYDTSNSWWGVEGEAASVAPKSGTADYTGTNYSGTATFRTRLFFDIEVTSDGLTIEPEIEGERVSGFNTNIDIHQGSFATLTLLQNN